MTDSGTSNAKARSTGPLSRVSKTTPLPELDESTDGFDYLPHAGVGQGHAVAEASAAETFALAQTPEHLFRTQVRVGIREQHTEPLQEALFAAQLQAIADAVGNDEAGGKHRMLLPMGKW